MNKKVAYAVFQRFSPLKMGSCCKLFGIRYKLGYALKFFGAFQKIIACNKSRFFREQNDLEPTLFQFKSNAMEIHKKRLSN